MNLSSTLMLYAGGPGSGCNPEKGKCGRPSSRLDIKELKIEADPDADVDDYTTKTWWYGINDPSTGDEIARVAVSRPEWEYLYVNWVQRSGETPFKPSAWKEVLRFITEKHPGVTSVIGDRLGGVRKGREQTVTVLNMPRVREDK
jgi:hypothetical protein